MNNIIQYHLQQCLPIFTGLGDEHRQKIALLLMAHTRLNVNQLTELMPISRPAVSHHLKLMLQSELVAVEQIGNERFYKMNVNYDDPNRCPIQRLKSLVLALEQSLSHSCQ